MRGATEYRGVEQLEARRAHNPEVVGSSPASATIENSRFRQKTAVFLTFWPKLILGAKQHFLVKVPESCIQNGKALFLLYNSTEYSE